jgi:predicted DCC family thiol-disulfide oxidoreductase YuxK
MLKKLRSSIYLTEPHLEGKVFLEHVVFYDGECPFCNRSVLFLLSVDKQEIFYFSPLNGETAKDKLQGLHLKNPNLDTLVLLENYQKNEKIFIEGKAVLRILWLLGGKYALIGWLSFLPSFLFDYVYRIVARYRYRLFTKKGTIQSTNTRFLK